MSTSSSVNLPHVDVQATKAMFPSKAASAITLNPTIDDSRMLHIGIIGCGRIGQLHAENIVHKIPDAMVVCVSDVFESAARKLAEKHSIPMACTDPADLIHNPAVQAVLVCSPTDTHADIIRKCVAAGKHIFCEKPVDKNLEVINELEHVLEASPVKFFLGFQRRFDAHFQRAKQALESGFLGKPLKLHLVSRDPAPPPIGYLKQSGGIFLDMTSHDFDMARFLVGSDIEEISAVAMADNADIAAIGDYDHTIITIKFENGVVGTIDNSRASPLGYDQRANFMGTQGSVQVDNLVPNTCSTADKMGTHEDAPLNFFMERYAEAYVKEMKTFVDVCKHDKPVPCGVEDGRLTIIYGACANLSLKEKRTVKVSEIDKPRSSVADIKEASARY
eukprot:GFKZ01001124.1.p1 GENE.GFKZ01001124.1~~GFKZ01001124.1.p1  ORF type:complete len:390 (-),score=62.33 GFKZ01001124.1:451-1620(-)